MSEDTSFWGSAGSFYDKFQDSKSNVQESTVNLFKSLESITKEDPYSDEDIAARALSMGAQGAASGGPIGAAVGVGLSLTTSLINKRKMEKEATRQRKEQVRQISDQLQGESLTLMNQQEQQALKKTATIDSLQTQFTQGIQQYQTFFGEGTQSVSAKRASSAYYIEGQGAIDATYQSFDESMQKVTDRIDYIKKARSNLRGSDDLKKTRNILSGYSSLLESQYG